MAETLAIIIISLLFSALFSGIEIAFVSSDKLQIRLQSEKGAISGKILSIFLNKPSNFISTTLIGNTLALVVYGIFMAKILEPVIIMYLPEVARSAAVVLVIQTLLSTLVVLVTAEFTPKSLFMINPQRMLTLFSIPMFIIYYLLYPFVWLIGGLSKFVLVRIIGLEYNEEKPVYGLSDLNNYIRNIIGADSDQEVEIDTKIFTNALEFKTVRVRECMVPRTEISAVDITDNVDELLQSFVESGHSKIVVYRESIDDVVGYIHTLELFKKPEEIAKIVTPLLIVPETMLANELMIQFITERKSMALVVDEFGGTSGVVTMEDIIEEIFGEIQDEYDVDEWIEEQLDERNYLISARHEIDYLNDKYGWTLPTGEYETVGGYILSIIEDLPQKNEELEAYPYKFTIVSVEDIRIDIVKITLLEAPTA